MLTPFPFFVTDTFVEFAPREHSLQRPSADVILFRHVVNARTLAILPERLLNIFLSKNFPAQLKSASYSFLFLLCFCTRNISTTAYRHPLTSLSNSSISISLAPSRALCAVSLLLSASRNSIALLREIFLGRFSTGFSKFLEGIHRLLPFGDLETYPEILSSPSKYSGCSLLQFAQPRPHRSSILSLSIPLVRKR